MAHYDLHCHSTASDGRLTPTEVVRRAHANGVRVLALTDHDGTSGLEEAASVARDLALEFVPGVEVSVTWGDTTIHVVGLGFDAESRVLQEGLATVNGSRLRRGEAIADELRRLGIEGTLDAALAHANDPRSLSRAHFARVLVEQGYAPDNKTVFKRFLSKGKPGYVPHQWAKLEDVVHWIDAAGGVAVIAHPGRYALTEAENNALFTEFRDAGGMGVEVLTGSHTPQQARTFAAYAKQHGLFASCGSDFHGPQESRVDLGGLPALPDDLRAVWERF